MEENHLDDSVLHRIRHSSAHLLAQAVKSLWPDVKLGVGPVIEDGFYYDFLKKEPFSTEDLEKIRERMKEIVKKGLPIEKVSLSKSELKAFFDAEPLKNELRAEIEESGGVCSFYKQGDFVDLCRGPHVENTKLLKHWELTRVSGAYWRGDSRKQQLQRIYGVAFESKDALKEKLQQLERAELYNHRRIGEELELFTHFDKIGKGLIVWLPKGETIRREVETYAVAVEDAAGYLRVRTPVLARKELFEQSGHLPFYAESMYPPMEMDDGEYYLKSMNCPGHHLIFSKKLRSYRELPLRIAEFGIVHRNELSGVLQGLQRVRGMVMNDAHIYCTKAQIEEEVRAVLQMTLEYFRVFGVEKYWFRLSRWDPEKKEKFIDEPENWAFAEEALRKVLDAFGVRYVEAVGEAAFYGPKIDVQLTNVFGKDDTVSTVQLDFIAKRRFHLHYDDVDGKQNPEVFVIHRAPLGTHERFMAFLIEQYAGAFPLWLSPVQVRVLTVTDRVIPFAQELVSALQKEGLRAELDARSESISKKVRHGIKEKVNYLVTIGDKELETGVLAVRDRSGAVKQVKRDAFIAALLEEVKHKRC